MVTLVSSIRLLVTRLSVDLVHSRHMTAIPWILGREYCTRNLDWSLAVSLSLSPRSLSLSLSLSRSLISIVSLIILRPEVVLSSEDCCFFGCDVVAFVHSVSPTAVSCPPVVACSLWRATDESVEKTPKVPNENTVHSKDVLNLICNKDLTDLGSNSRADSCISVFRYYQNHLS